MNNRAFDWEQGLGWQATIYNGAKTFSLVHNERVVDVEPIARDEADEESVEAGEAGGAEPLPAEQNAALDEPASDESEAPEPSEPEEGES